MEVQPSIQIEIRSGMTKRSEIIDLEDGAVIAFNKGQSFYFTCCDCCLTHKIESLLVDGEIQLKITRDDRRTAQKRRRLSEKQAAEVFAD